MPVSKGKLFQHQEEETNIDECAVRSSAPTTLPKPDRCLPKIAEFWWEFSVSAARPNCTSNFSKLCPWPIWLPFFLPTPCWQEYMYSKGFSTVLMSGVLCLLMLQCKDKPESEIPLWETQTRFS